ncbi:MAG TPA: bifunctional phosphopantothenoylcysteine decarboxylase/phosphopantothenate--cysteine ligase CoaBC [Actinomycetota bacterium]|nr:bifunctional phosphopantothenoylcysteine decarboxylase/phosphopantothenate--cysteine ligase CoaBC [Actinomycetota bacterium]
MSRRVLLGITGGVAAYKSAHLARLLTAAGVEVTVVMTESATRFVGPDTFAALTGRPVHTSLWERPGEVLHVRLAHEADLAIVAPATANLLAKLAHGLADDLLTSTLLEYAGPLVIAPAMHTGMWEHPATRGNVETLEGRGVTFVGPVEGALAHGDSGVGRLAEPEVIAAEVLAVLDGAGAGSLNGRTVVVTAGPTYEPIDPVRFIGNHSSGKMGVAVAAEAIRRGATVHLILGPGTVAPPAGAQVVRIATAEQMREAVMRQADDTDAIVMAAAVADFRPKDAATGKLKKDDGTPEVRLEPTPDILAELGERPQRPYLVGFAAETSDVEAHGRAKLARKHADLLVANEVGREGTGFGSETNHAAIVSVNGDDIALRDWTKRELAAVIVDRIEAALRAAPSGR